MEEHFFRTMGQTPITEELIHAETGEVFEVKPEDLTHLRGNQLIEKNHPRIIFRGQLDSLSAEIVLLQTIAKGEEFSTLRKDLGEIGKRVGCIMHAEIMETPLVSGKLIGLTEDEIRYQSHEPEKYFGVQHLVAHYSMGEIPVRLNQVRAMVREVELSAIVAYGTNAAGWRQDIIRELNRLSSAVYILYCKTIAPVVKG